MPKISGYPSNLFKRFSKKDASVPPNAIKPLYDPQYGYIYRIKDEKLGTSESPIRHVLDIWINSLMDEYTPFKIYLSSYDPYDIDFLSCIISNPRSESLCEQMIILAGDWFWQTHNEGQLLALKDRSPEKVSLYKYTKPGLLYPEHRGIMLQNRVMEETFYDPHAKIKKVEVYEKTTPRLQNLFLKSFFEEQQYSTIIESPS